MKRDLWRSMSELALPISAWSTYLLVKRRQRTGKGLWDRGTAPVRGVHCDNIVICARSAHVAILDRLYRLTVPVSINLRARVGCRKNRRDRQKAGKDGSHDDRRVGCHYDTQNKSIQVGIDSLSEDVEGDATALVVLCYGCPRIASYSRTAQVGCFRVEKTMFVGRRRNVCVKRSNEWMLSCAEVLLSIYSLTFAFVVVVGCIEQVKGREGKLRAFDDSMTNAISFPLRLGSSAKTASGRKTASWEERKEGMNHGSLHGRAGKCMETLNGTDSAARYVIKSTSTTSIKIHNYWK